VDATILASLAEYEAAQTQIAIDISRRGGLGAASPSIVSEDDQLKAAIEQSCLDALAIPPAASAAGAGLASAPSLASMNPEVSLEDAMLASVMQQSRPQYERFVQKAINQYQYVQHSQMLLRAGCCLIIESVSIWSDNAIAFFCMCV
jgi:hypothetical protein